MDLKLWLVLNDVSRMNSALVIAPTKTAVGEIIDLDPTDEVIEIDLSEIENNGLAVIGYILNAR